MAALGIPGCSSPRIAHDTATEFREFGPEARVDDPDRGGTAEANIAEPVTSHPKIKVKEWQMQLKLEARSIEKDIKQIQRDEARLRRKMAAQEQRCQAQGLQELEASIGESQQAVDKLERIRDVVQAVVLDLTGRVAIMRTQQSLLSTDILRKMEAIVQVRGHMQELQHDMVAFGGQEASAAMAATSAAGETGAAALVVAPRGDGRPRQAAFHGASPASAAAQEAGMLALPAPGALAPLALPAGVAPLALPAPPAAEHAGVARPGPLALPAPETDAPLALTMWPGPLALPAPVPAEETTLALLDSS